MPNVKLTKRVIDSAKAGTKDTILWDTDLKGFGCKITPAGHKVYFCYYRTKGGQQRRPKIGDHGVLTCEEAREVAKRWLAEAGIGGDPGGSLQAQKTQITFDAFADQYLEQHARTKKKASSVAADERNLNNHIRPMFGKLPIAAIGRMDVVCFHQKMKGKPGAANRCLALLSKMFNLAELWGFRPDNSNPCRHVSKYPERKLERYLTKEEFKGLGAQLQEKKLEKGMGPIIAAIIELLIFTGCRRDEILTLKWDDVSCNDRCLYLKDSKTGAKIVHLNSLALDVLQGLKLTQDNPFVFPGEKPGQHFAGIEKAWQRLRKKINLSDVRLHDLRHSFASVAASSGINLPMIGALLGHREVSTTQRYAHLSADPLRQANEEIGKKIAKAMRKK
ncbi:MAG TPA: integrase [Rhodospirillaceae bacterium]|nr:MAG: hypothetical protein A2018_02460 [Alphaproteobacteria bacterium GWF2_58_20]HAU29491.1 integrase [Rhodospirillaceae bacterium]